MRTAGAPRPAAAKNLGGLCLALARERPEAARGAPSSRLRFPKAPAALRVHAVARRRAAGGEGARGAPGRRAHSSMATAAARPPPARTPSTTHRGRVWGGWGGASGDEAVAQLYFLGAPWSASRGACARKQV